MAARRLPRHHVITDADFDVLSDADLARSLHAVDIASRWLRVGTQLWLDHIVHINDVIDEHNEVSTELVQLACLKVIKQHPGAARMGAIGVTVADIGVVAQWVAAGETAHERVKRKALVMESFSLELERISRAHVAKRTRPQLDMEV